MIKKSLIQTINSKALWFRRLEMSRFYGPRTSGYIMNCPTTDKSLFTLRKEWISSSLIPKVCWIWSQSRQGWNIGEWLGLSPVVCGSGPWDNLCSNPTLNQVTGTSTLHDTDAWLLSVTGEPGNERGQGGGTWARSDIQASGKPEEATCSAVKHCKCTAFAKPCHSIFIWSNLCCPWLKLSSFSPTPITPNSNPILMLKKKKKKKNILLFWNLCEQHWG